MGMMCSLLDAKKEWPDKNLPLPDAFLSISGFFDLRIGSYPCSLILESYFNSYQRLHLFFGAYSPFEPEVDDYRSGKEFEKSEAFQKHLKIVMDPLMSPLLYNDIE